MVGWRAWLDRRGHSAHSRTLVKTALYRVLMVVVTVLVALLFTNEPALSVKIGVGANAVKTVIYYLYERAWAHVSWGLE